ncbi:MAG: polyprenol monophosphomannose synthase [Brevinema sp.]
MKGVVVMPTYNEAGNIERILPMILKESSLDILVVDDSSPDGTADLVRAAEGFGTRIHLMSRTAKDGLGRAYIAGFCKALEMSYDYVIQMDADLSHSPSDLKKFSQVIEKDGAKACFGSRYSNGVRVIDWDVKRLLLSIFANQYARIMTGVPCSDLTGGFNCYTAEVLRRIDFDKIRARGYMFQIEMKSATQYMGFKMVDVPIIFYERTVGVAKMHGMIIFEALFGCPWMRVRKLFGRLPIKKS